MLQRLWSWVRVWVSSNRDRRTGIILGPDAPTKPKIGWAVYESKPWFLKDKK